MTSLDSWHEEKQSAWLYRALAACEPDAKIAELFRALAAAADFQADKWLANAGRPAPPEFAPSVRARITAGLARAFGPRRVRHMLAAMKVRGLSVYDSQRSLAGHSEARGSEVLAFGLTRACLLHSGVDQRSDLTGETR